MTPEEICALLNENKHDGRADWEYRDYVSEGESGAWSYFSPMTPYPAKYTPFISLSAASAEIIAQHYAGLERRA